MYSKLDYCYKYIEDNFHTDEFEITELKGKIIGYSLTDKNNYDFFVYYLKDNYIHVVGFGVSEKYIVNMKNENGTEWRRPLDSEGL